MLHYEIEVKYQQINEHMSTKKINSNKTYATSTNTIRTYRERVHKVLSNESTKKEKFELN